MRDKILPSHCFTIPNPFTPINNSHSQNRLLLDVAIATTWTLFLGIPLFVVFLLLIYYELYLHGVQASFSVLPILGKVIPYHLVTLLLWSTIFGTAVFAVRKVLAQRKQLAKVQERLDITQTQALTDELTGVWNRRGFEMLLQTGLERAGNLEQPYALILADLDNFKQYNDSHGHLAGDQALKRIAQIMGDCVRLEDAVTRYGGDEFAILCPGLGWKDTIVMLRRLQVHAKKISITLSLGASVFPLDGESRSALLEAADKRLYKVKNRQKKVVKPSRI